MFIYIIAIILRKPKSSKEFFFVTSQSTQGQNLSKKISNKWKIIHNDPTFRQTMSSNPSQATRKQSIILHRSVLKKLKHAESTKNKEWVTCRAPTN